MPETVETPLLRDRAFVLFLLARTVAVVGSAITTVALPLLVFQVTSSPLVTSLVTAMQVAPYLLFGLIAGAMADRLPRRRLMLGCQAVSAAALLSVPVASWIGQLTAPHAVVVAAVVATSFVWFDASSFGALPALVGRSRVVPANSMIWTVTTLAGLGGPVVGGALVATVGAAPALSFDAASYVVAGALLALIGRSFDAPDARTRSPETLRTGIREGLQFVRRQPVVRSLTLLGFGNSVTGGAVSALLVVFAVRDLGLSEQGSGIGVLVAVVAAGAFLAAVALRRLTDRVPIGWITIATLSTNPVALLLTAYAPSLPLAITPLLLWSFTSTLTILNGITARQLVTPLELQARVNTTARMLAWGGTPLGALAAGLLAEFTSARHAYAVMSSAVLISAILAWRSPLRARSFGVPAPALQSP
ncbi:major facilitator superfamily MFS_1 [Kribbella flavida DSM 17836]|uniref:Major facilitator superfamily MFS_1 n=1 Tax=Kribbella flavida (strain DSM 17836 / JCM 10339 / NBRC 14399) TaxID=479435 RepID=D2PWM2_KRIFD|nr:MFS transporter [Kribbella flavida]ADB33491.1 major facilitator superfamily MFS_1 [Kribbella flavida DSM 17836]